MSKRPTRFTDAGPRRSSWYEHGSPRGGSFHDCGCARRANRRARKRTLLQRLQARRLRRPCAVAATRHLGTRPPGAMRRSRPRSVRGKDPAPSARLIDFCRFEIDKYRQITESGSRSISAPRVARPVRSRFRPICWHGMRASLRRRSYTDGWAGQLVAGSRRASFLTRLSTKDLRRALFSGATAEEVIDRRASRVSQASGGFRSERALRSVRRDGLLPNALRSLHCSVLPLRPTPPSSRGKRGGQVDDRTSGGRSAESVATRHAESVRGVGLMRPVLVHCGIDCRVRAAERPYKTNNSAVGSGAAEHFA